MCKSYYQPIYCCIPTHAPIRTVFVGTSRTSTCHCGVDSIVYLDPIRSEDFMVECQACLAEIMRPAAAMAVAQVDPEDLALSPQLLAMGMDPEDLALDVEEMDLMDLELGEMEREMPVPAQVGFPKVDFTQVGDEMLDAVRFEMAQQLGGEGGVDEFSDSPNVFTEEQWAALHTVECSEMEE